MLDIFRIGNLSFCCAASRRSKLKSLCAQSLEIEFLWTCAILKWIQKLKTHFRCLMQTIMVSLTLQSLWRWEYQNIFFVKVEIPKLRYAKGLAMFTMKNVERERKLRFLFDIYDIDGDGLICNSELYKVGECQQRCRLSICILVELTKSTLSFYNFLKRTDGSNLEVSILITVYSTIYRRRYKKSNFSSSFYKVLKMMVGSNLKEDQLQQIVDKTILQVTNNIFLLLFYQ